MNIKKTATLLFCVFFLLFFMFFKEEVFFNVQKTFFNPCSSPVIYTIGSVDSGFGLTEDEFLFLVNEAANKWNKSMNRELFQYGDNGMKINLLYDYRQDATIEIKNIDSEYQEYNEEYYQLVEKYNSKVDLYNIKKSELELIISEYNKRFVDLQRDISLWKRNNKEEYDRLNQEKESLEKLLFEINKKQLELNKAFKEISSLTVEINNIAAILNINVEEYNSAISELSNQFEQGNYISGPLLKEINIYQYENKESLLQVLIHELGHALGLKHTTNSGDIMYWINTEEEQTITEDSLDQLRNICYE